MEQFLRVAALLGEAGLKTLKQKKITVIGLGAVGSFAVEALARSGVGHIRIVDFDRVSVTNLNRQLFALNSTLGKFKTEVAESRLRDINPALNLEVYCCRAGKESFEKILDNKPDLVLDAIDSLSDKVGLLTYCFKAGIRVISSMGAAMKTRPELIKTADIMKSIICPLAREVRKGLKRNGVGKGIWCVYSTEQPERDPERLERLGAMDQEYQANRRRSLLGSLGTLTGIFGLTLGQLALDKLLDEKQSSSAE